MGKTRAENIRGLNFVAVELTTYQVTKLPLQLKPCKIGYNLLTKAVLIQILFVL
jgi:hypothetical protein